MNTSCLVKHIEDKSLVWFEVTNQYLIVEQKTGSILEQIHKQVPLHDIAANLARELNVPLEKAIDFSIDIEKFYLQHTQQTPNEIINDYRDILPPKHFEYTKFYQIDDNILKVEYASEKEIELIHLKFAHLEINPVSEVHHTFLLFTDHQYTFLYVNKVFIGAWSPKEVHYFQGKFSMELIQAIYHKPEEDWLGVFHASAVAKNGKSMLFLGDSGNGKSTSLALLQAHGFDCIADDFVPIDAQKKAIYEFPAAISIKRNSVPVLQSYYPQLAESEEFHLKRLDKHVRYLPPQKRSSEKHIPCHGFVFIKYQANSTLSLHSISNITAFENLVPDSWLSPLAVNAIAFLDWFCELPCYQLTYSDTSEMIEAVTKLYKGEL